MRTQPKFEVVVWIKKGEDFAKLRDEVLGLAVEEPFESTEYEGMLDFHWGFDCLADAESVAQALNALCHNPEFVLLRLMDWENLDNSVTFKDERRARH
jgi:hypothetical protein